VGRINVSFDTRYPIAQELVIEADLATAEPTATIIAGAIARR
jgi:hypothetical protein